MAPVSPRLTMRRKTPPTPNQIAFRYLVLVACLLNPVAAPIYLVFITVGRLLLRGKIKGYIILLVGLAGVATGILLGWHTSYISPWVDTWEIARTAWFDAYVSKLDIPQMLKAHALESWPSWILTQLPFATMLALTTAGAYLTWRDYYTDDWRANTTPTREPASPKAVERAKRKQNASIETATPVSTVKQVTVPLGVDAYTATPISVPADAWRTHALVCGPTGVGKSQALMRIMHAFTLHPQAANLKVPLVVVDMKADPELAAYAAEIAHRTGRSFHLVTVRDGSYNPLLGLDADEMADAIYETVFAQDPTINTHYATLSRRLLQTAAHILVDLASTRTVRVGYGRPWQIGLADLTDLLSLPMLRSIQMDLTPEAARRLHTYLHDVEAADNEQDVGDVRDRMAVIMHTRAGSVLAATGFDLEATIRAGDIIVFSLDAAGSPETARTIGSLAVQDLTAVFGRLQRIGWGKHHICPVILDEFSALGTPKVADLYARARAGGGAIILATQDIVADLEAVSPEFAASVRTNANIWLVLRQTRADVAEALARDIGSQATWKETLQITDDFDLLGGLHAASGVGSLREVEEFILHPTQFKTLPQGGAYLIVKIPVGSLHAGSAQTAISRIHINAPEMLHPTYTQHSTEQPPARPHPPTPVMGEPTPVTTGVGEQWPGVPDADEYPL